MLQKSIARVVSGHGGGYGLKSALLCASWLYQAGVRGKQFLDYALLKRPAKVNARVVCIGNIIAGGSGKTPFLERLLKDMDVSLEQVAVISRGYKGRYASQIEVLHLNKEPELTAQLCGDESYMLYKKFPVAGFFVSKNRYKAAAKAVCSGAKLVFLDDGLQHRSLFQDVKVVVLHADKLFGGKGVEKGFFLPRGPLRDFPSRLKRADFVVVNHAGQVQVQERVKAALKRFVSCPIIYTSMGVRGFFDQQGEVQVAAKTRVGVFCGLGSPDSFVELLEEKGLDVATTWKLGDHEKPSEMDLVAFANKAKAVGCEKLICTEKDWVKLIKKEGYALPICFMSAEMEITGGSSAYQTLLSSVQKEVE